MLWEELAISALMDFITSPTAGLVDAIFVEQPLKFAIKMTKLVSVKRTCKVKNVINVSTALITSREEPRGMHKMFLLWKNDSL
jgi:hypothetical protein